MPGKKAQKNTSIRNTYAGQADQNCLFISLSDLGISLNSLYEVKPNNQLSGIFSDLVVFTPSKQSHLGKKISEYSRLNSRNTEKFLQDVFNSLGIKKNVFLFKTFIPTKRKLNDVFPAVIESTDQLLILRCDSGVKESLFMAVRNAIAHGNIVYDGKFYTLYSVADDKKEYESEVTFLLRIDRLEKLSKLRKTLEAYS